MCRPVGDGPAERGRVKREATIALLLVGVLAVTAHALLYGWPRDQLPPLPFKTALEKAERAKPEDSFCRDVVIFADRDGRSGTWNFIYDSAGDTTAIVHVSMTGEVGSSESRREPPSTRPSTTHPSVATPRPPQASPKKQLGLSYWPEAKETPISLATAFAAAFDRAGDAMQTRFCTAASLKLSRKGDGTETAAWQFDWYDSVRRAPFKVIVEENGKARIER